jgi:hypothetical protein
MARNYFEIEKGLRITDVNSDSGIELIQGSGIPDFAQTNEAGLGSIYIDRTNAKIYQKKTDTNNDETDWSEVANSSSLIDPKWRNEKVVAITTEDLSGLTKDLTTPLTGDDTPFLGATDFSVGEFILAQDDSSNWVLYEVTDITGDVLTLAVADPALADDDVLVIQNYLLNNPGDKENQAIVIYENNNIIKVADVNWNSASGISMGSDYDSTGVNGNVSINDTINSAIEKLEGNQQDIQTSLGIAQGDLDLGEFTGDTIPDDQTVKQALQALETAHETLADEVEALGIGNVEQAVPVSTPTVVDQVPTASILAVKWLVVVRSTATPTNRQAFEVFALNNGAVADDTVYAKLRVGSNFNISLTVDIDSGNMRLTANSTLTGGVIVNVKRLEVIDLA